MSSVPIWGLAFFDSFNVPCAVLDFHNSLKLSRDLPGAGACAGRRLGREGNMRTAWAKRANNRDSTESHMKVGLLSYPNCKPVAASH